MKIDIKDPPRVYTAGKTETTVFDCAEIRLDPDEQVTFYTPGGAEYDVTRKSWGFYATPSMNGRLAGFGLRAALVKGADGKTFIHLVESGKESEYDEYRRCSDLALVCWLDGSQEIDL